MPYTIPNLDKADDDFILLHLEIARDVVAGWKQQLALMVAGDQEEINLARIMLVNMIKGCPDIGLSDVVRGVIEHNESTMKHFRDEAERRGLI